GVEQGAGASGYSTMEPCPMCAGAMKMARIARLVLGTRHATLKRTDLGTYSIESFCKLTGYDLALTTGVRESECTALRRRWGKDPVRPSRPPARVSRSASGGVGTPPSTAPAPASAPRPPR